MGKYNLEDWFEVYDGLSSKEEVYLKTSKEMVALQLHGFEVVLNEDGTYFLNDTSGG